MLPEGSMLDALIVQMPGVEIKDGGKIYVNGRFVETLLLNGKDFFKGDQNVMLENIGAYAVKDVAVYEKKDDMDAILGDRADVDKDYVMDVRLKKDYMAGFMINAEAGGGTKSRYLGRLFAMSYTNNTRVSLYGNANNINKKNRLTQEEFELYDGDGEGITRKINGGIDYLADNALHTWEASGNVDASYNDNRNTIITNAVNFLQTVDNYDFSNRDMRARDFSLSTFHDFKLKKDSWNMTLKPQFSYNKKRDNDETVAATFSEEMQGIDKEMVRSIYTLNDSELRKALINRNLKNLESNSHRYDAQFNGETRVKIPGSSDAMVFKLQSKYFISGGISNYSNMVGYDADPTPQKVRNYTFQEDIDLGYRTEKYLLSVSGGVAVNNTHSAGVLPTRLNNGVWFGRLYGHVALPFNFSVDTEFNVVKRYGYFDELMNTTDCVWNATLGYEINKGVWRISLDAKDIQNQNKGLNYTVNANGRTQTLNTVLPRYLMLSVHYRFDFKPRRK